MHIGGSVDFLEQKRDQEFKDRVSRNVSAFGRGIKNFGFHPFDTLDRQFGYAGQIFDAASNGDYSQIQERWNRLDYKQKEEFIAERGGELFAEGAAIWLTKEAGLAAYEAYGVRLASSTAGGWFIKHKERVENFFSLLRRNGNQEVSKLSDTARQNTKAIENVLAYTRSNLKHGQEMHRLYKLGVEGVKKEFRLPSGKRIDALDMINHIIYELKPFNPRSIKLGNKALEIYKQEL
ncbi:MAG: hypothetical protein AB7E63_00400 [Parachlamydia sp.]|nr:hypothetical protein pah_c006o005 [Parachlamydia acanthamoebae str. Hall's coccus]